LQQSHWHLLPFQKITDLFTIFSQLYCMFLFFWAKTSRIYGTSKPKFLWILIRASPVSRVLSANPRTSSSKNFGEGGVNPKPPLISTPQLTAKRAIRRDRSRRYVLRRRLPSLTAIGITGRVIRRADLTLSIRSERVRAGPTRRGLLRDTGHNALSAVSLHFI